MPRSLDHVVHVVRDLDAAAALYRRLGFTVGPRNTRPWGTQDHIVQFPSFFVQLLAVDRQERDGGEGLEAFFTNFNSLFLRRQEGLSFLVLDSTDARVDAATFRAARIGISDVLDCDSARSQPGGPLGFSLVFVRDPASSSIGFAACQHHHPENFWNEEVQRHANSADGVAGAVLVAENPTDHHIFLSAFTGVRELLATSSGVTAPTRRGDVQIMDPAAYRSHFGVEPPDVTDSARLCALRLKVHDRDALHTALDGGNIAYSVHMGAVVVGPDTAMGATLVFDGP